jgi:hypothetical protein
VKRSDSNSLLASEATRIQGGIKKRALLTIPRRLRWRCSRLQPIRTRCDAVAIEAHIDQIQEGLDVDGNGLTDALTDELLIIRYLFGFSGTALTGGAVGDGYTRCTAGEIGAYCATLVP